MRRTIYIPRVRKEKEERDRKGEYNFTIHEAEHFVFGAAWYLETQYAEWAETPYPHRRWHDEFAREANEKLMEIGWDLMEIRLNQEREKEFENLRPYSN